MASTNVVRMRPVLPSLYELEEGLVALLDTEAMVTPEQEAEFQRELEEQLDKTVAKRDRVGAFLKTLDTNAAFAGEEIKRLQARKRVFESVAERLRGYVLGLIERLGPDAKGKLRKLEGERFTLSARACPVSLVISDEGKVPDAYKDVTVTMAAAQWEAVVGKLKDIQVASVHYSVNNAAVKAVLNGPPVPCERCNGIGIVQLFENAPPTQCGICHGACSLAPTVAGADLVVGRNTLVVK